MKIALGLLLASSVSLASGRQALINNLENLAGERLLESQKELILTHPELVLPPADEVDDLFKGLKIPDDEALKICYEKCTGEGDKKVCHKVCIST